MANEEHLAILRQGVEVWNQWRKENPEIEPDLIGAELNHANLRKINLSGADLSKVNFVQANLQDAVFIRSKLREANLSYAKLQDANLSEANLRLADLSHADLRKTNLRWASLKDSNLSHADLSSAYLIGANLIATNLEETNFQESVCAETVFTRVDLSQAKNLHLVRHTGPSTIGIDSLYQSKGNIPREFLEGCGIPETMITFAKSLVGTPIEYYSCFISYSTKDEAFAQQLNDRMKREGLRVWFAPEEMKGGQKIHEQLYEAIRYHDKLILVLSEASMKSNWVQSEIRRARKHEREEGRRKLFPISLVPFGEIQQWELFDSDEGRDLAQEIREYYIPDFCQWKDYDKFNAGFERLLRDLRAED